MKAFIHLTLLFFIPAFCTAQASSEQLLESKLDSTFKTLFSANEPGGSIFIQQGNKVLYKKSFGLADLKTRTKFNEHTISNLGSVSKTFVAYGILLLNAQGRLSIDDSIGKFFPDFVNRELAAKIKIRHLLSHTSGLPDSRNVMGDSIFYLTAKDWENFKPLLATDTLEFEQGTQWNYSNPAYNALALIIEKVSKENWQHFIRRSIFLPSGMKNSKITDGAFPDKKVAHGYQQKGNTYEEYDYGECPTFCAAGNGGVWSSVAELRKYIKAMADCRFADCSVIEASKKAWRPENWKANYAPFHSMVWFIHPDFSFRKKNQTLKNVLIEHSGDQGGFKAHLIMIPEKELTIIWLTNNNKFITGQIRKILLDLKYIE
jgi:CubicO group peptidase (beta-lactamase class C family)